MPPAARLGDNHTCPLLTGFTPHVGGPISAGSPTVRIAGMLAARVGDSCVCNGPPDVIVKGSATVTINGRPAARLGDTTAHGGVVVAGAPTVNIGG
ncbi:PAAR domain-containing protein [Deinococcus navajonensis]|uniref:PAAR domain-containing protein n=1 Tax=Deinococcus navajonensis TaxID=309884 RepID=A0ABV8XPX2_9DEIO